MTTIDKLPHVKPYLVRTDENWEKWDMGELITTLEKWIKRNKPNETSSNVPDNSRFKKEKHVKLLTLWIKERNSSLREKTSVRAGSV